MLSIPGGPVAQQKAVSRLSVGHDSTRLDVGQASLKILEKLYLF
jgi:hypothetical protein